jgi:hypothetical protein
VKSPIAWNGRSFLHTSSDDRDDFYEGPDGRLRNERAKGHWLAALRGATAVAGPTQHVAFEAESDVARAALNGALEVLRSRVAADSAWLAALDVELGGGP